MHRESKRGSTSFTAQRNIRFRTLQCRRSLQKLLTILATTCASGVLCFETESSLSFAINKMHGTNNVQENLHCAVQLDAFKGQEHLERPQMKSIAKRSLFEGRGRRSVTHHVMASKQMRALLSPATLFWLMCSLKSDWSIALHLRTYMTECSTEHTAFI